MKFEFPGAVPEIPVRDLGAAAAYYENNLGFGIDWGGEELGSSQAFQRKLQDVSGKLSRVSSPHVSKGLLATRPASPYLRAGY